MSLRTYFSLAALALATALAGCSTPVKLDQPAKVESRDTGSGTQGAAPGGAAAGGTPQSQVATVDLARQRAEQEASARAAALASLPRILYFDFDSFSVRPEYREALEGYARVLAAERGRRMSLEGHADERGGREYNLALGQKRAEAVARALELLGVDPKQVEAVSFGEERPADSASNEAAWAKNRRVELKDR